MSLHRLFLALTVCVACSSVSLSQAYAPGTSYTDLYSQGVRAYFSGNSQQAEQRLSEALMQNAHDPRAYYFRGLARIRSGRRYEGEQDFRVGASLEASYRGLPLGMGRTLERVQGSDRLLLERIRKEARESSELSQTHSSQQRYQPARDRSQQRVRTRFRLPLSALSTAKTPQDLADLAIAQADSVGDPFADDSTLEAPPTTPQPSTDDSPAMNSASQAPDGLSATSDQTATTQAPAEQPAETSDPEANPFADPVAPESALEESGNLFESDDPFGDDNPFE